MATIKFTFLFDWQRRCGWSETFYHTISASESNQEIQQQAQRWAAERVRVMTGSATLLSARCSDIATPRKVTIVELGLKGALGVGIVLNNLQPDVVNIAQFVTFNSEGEERRFYLMRGLDDRDVNDGIIDFLVNGKSRYTRFFNFLQSAGWRMKDFTKSDQTNVIAIDGETRSVDIGNAAAFNRDDIVLIQSRTAGQGLKLRWQGRVETKVANILTLKGYHQGNAEGGKIFRLTATYPDLTSWAMKEPNWARTRQTGRPFDLPRGRAPKKT